MGSLFRYAGVNARVKTLMSKMLNDKDYDELLQMSSIQNIYNYLYEKTDYTEHLEKISGQEIHRLKFERTLKKSFLNDYNVILLYLSGPARLFFKYLFNKFKIEDLKLLLRTILIEHDEDYLKENLIYLGVCPGISINKLTQIKSYKDLLNVFDNTDYYDILHRFEERYKRDKNLFPIEMSLDFRYFTELGRRAKRLNSDDYRVVRDLLGTQIDLLNINWIYRIKRFYDLNQEEILNYTLPYHYRLSEEDLKELSRLNDAEDIFTYLVGTSYNMLFPPDRQDRTILFEEYFLSYLFKKAKKSILNGNFNIGIVSGYLFLKEYEIKDIITIIEGVRYQLNSEEIKKYLIRD